MTIVMVKATIPCLIVLLPLGLHRVGCPEEHLPPNLEDDLCLGEGVWLEQAGSGSPGIEHQPISGPRSSRVELQEVLRALGIRLLGGLPVEWGNPVAPSGKPVAGELPIEPTVTSHTIMRLEVSRVTSSLEPRAIGTTSGGQCHPEIWQCRLGISCDEYDVKRLALFQDLGWWHYPEISRDRYDVKWSASSWDLK
ncbi:hypothetical protein GW17_00039763 [Ensete ventricosum]|nr:hypothetical protein GW17_00039763 [Ensete ventricosum]